MGEMFLIEKNGWYYRPDASGYTGEKSEAGRYSFEEAAQRVGPNGPDGSQDGLSMWRESEAPEFSSGCPWDVKLLAPYKARIAELEGFLEEVISRNPEVHRSPCRDPQDEVPDWIEHEELLVLQEDARELLKGGAS